MWILPSAGELINFKTKGAVKAVEYKESFSLSYVQIAASTHHNVGCISPAHFFQVSCVPVINNYTRRESSTLFPFSHWFFIFSTVLKAFPGTGHTIVYMLVHFELKSSSGSVSQIQIGKLWSEWKNLQRKLLKPQNKCPQSIRYSLF